MKILNIVKVTAIFASGLIAGGYLRGYMQSQPLNLPPGARTQEIAPPAPARNSAAQQPPAQEAVALERLGAKDMAQNPKPELDRDTKERRVAQIAIHRAGLLTEVDRIYRPIFKKFNLPKEKMFQLRHLLAERESIPYLVSVASQSADGETDFAMMDAIRHQSQDEVTKRMNAILEPDELQQLTYFDSHRDEYSQTEAITLRLNADHLELGPEQEKAVISVLAKSNHDGLSQPAWGASQSEWDAYLQKQQSFDTSVVDALKPNLTAEQLQSLSEYYEDVRLPLKGLRDMAQK
jgi:hypothetical protein